MQLPSLHLLATVIANLSLAIPITSSQERTLQAQDLTLPAMGPYYSKNVPLQQVKMHRTFQDGGNDGHSSTPDLSSYDNSFDKMSNLRRRSSQDDGSDHGDFSNDGGKGPDFAGSDNGGFVDTPSAGSSGTSDASDSARLRRRSPQDDGSDYGDFSNDGGRGSDFVSSDNGGLVDTPPAGSGGTSDTSESAKLRRRGAF